MKIHIDPSDLPEELAGLGDVEIRSLDPNVVEKRDLEIDKLMQEPPEGFIVENMYFKLDNS